MVSGAGVDGTDISLPINFSFVARERGVLVGLPSNVVVSIPDL